MKNNGPKLDPKCKKCEDYDPDSESYACSVCQVAISRESDPMKTRTIYPELKIPYVPNNVVRDMPLNLKPSKNNPIQKKSRKPKKNIVVCSICKQPLYATNTPGTWRCDCVYDPVSGKGHWDKPKLLFA